MSFCSKGHGRQRGRFCSECGEALVSAERAHSTGLWSLPLGIVIILVVAFVLGRTWSGRGMQRGAKTTITQLMPTQPPAQAAGAPLSQVSTRDSMMQFLVPAGAFLMGSTDDDPAAADDEKPQHTAYLDAFWIDRTEVTQDQYRRCVAAGKCVAPTCGETAQGNHPVACVTWQDATAYCTWAGRRLPTEAEWEKAARGLPAPRHDKGAGGALYPWGDAAPDCNRANFWEGGDVPCLDGPAAAGSYPLAPGPYGTLDQAGNVSEWVADWYSANAYVVSGRDNPTGPAAGKLRVVRGGSWHDGRWDIRAAFRIGVPPDYAGCDLGFRCAQSR